MKKTSWKDPSRYITDLHVDESCRDDDYTQQIIKRFRGAVHYVPEGCGPDIEQESFADSLSAGKRHLFLTKQKGHFFKPCPATREYRCCDYHVLNTGMNCPIDCVYCILQAYLNNPWISFYVNTDRMLKEIDEVLSANPDQLYRIGTGEFTDSLAIDNITKLSEILVPFMRDKPNAMLELKTKSGVVENLETLEHGGNTIISWSLNSTRILKKEEIRAATLSERLASARQCVEWGYRVAFHFDPIIDHDNWENEYHETIDRLFAEVPAESIVWISLGALRYLPNLKDIGIRRFPGSNIYFQEFLEGLDGKQRYFRPNRTNLYLSLYNRIRQYSDERTAIYFCMESDEIWRDVMGFIPEEKGGVGRMLDVAFWQEKREGEE